MPILNLISGPRNISTALMYSFAQRDDTRVYDEPFYAVYLNVSGAQHPGRDEVLKTQSSSEEVVQKQILSSKDKPVVFIKNMAHHMEVLPQPFFHNGVNIFLIRDPAQIIASYAKVIETPVMRDIGVAYQYYLFNTLREHKNEPIVLDSGLLLRNPAAVLEELCHRCAIGFQSSMLTWNAGPKHYDGVWSNHWYKNVHQTTGFSEKITSKPVVPEHLETLYQQAMGYYEKLLPFSIKA